ncbi:MAG TPA: Re/Si-specific NAD(P)(+) transhydrogenase subunit alpha [Methylotenera sp.]|nr:Re/Si-specific NAD(P)(+) transhydrogenase subunit alpha [Methylotenera sp.]
MKTHSLVIGVPFEIKGDEQRVAATPETVKKILTLGCKVLVQKGAGERASITDAAYEAVGAGIVSAKEVFKADLILKVRAPEPTEIKAMKTGTVLIGLLEPFNLPQLNAIAAQGITAFSLEALPRNSRAQSMDVLSSQANVAGYKAVLLGSHFYQRFMPMLMTAAGTVKAARVLVLGAGVAGLQAIATARRLGAVVEASDVRPAVKEQIESLGAKFLEVPYETAEEEEIAAGVGGYARPMPTAWMMRQAQLVAQRAAEADIVITSALIPGREPPILLHAETVEKMKPGSVIIDMAAGCGGLLSEKSGCGNCPLTEANKVVVKHGVTIVGYTNLPSLVAADASAFYARNILEFLKLLITEGRFNIPVDDELVTATLMCKDGQLLKAS